MYRCLAVQQWVRGASVLSLVHFVGVPLTQIYSQNYIQPKKQQQTSIPGTDGVALRAVISITSNHSM